MDTNKMREQFEKIADEHYLLCELSLQRNEHQLDEYLDPAVQIAWEFFVASREAVVVELPESCEYAYPQGEYAKGHRIGKRDVVGTIEAQGLKVAP